MPGLTNPLEFQNPAQWRGWLEQNHASAGEAWLVIYKKKYRAAGLALEQAVEEALCFGWIDGRLQPLDEKRYALRFSPRAPNSTWSISNIRRVEKLVAEGKMTEAGQQSVAAAKKSGAWEAALRRELVDIIPGELERALRQHPGAISAYKALPASRKKQYIYWLQQAKGAETARRRIRKIVAEVQNQ
ncbi:MAG TPA: YdeI/OmpD-associated family protein [Anaerolineales bacterium]|nr:YdeI/OmpD-associated family protein [Anaerolineales bacterium]